MYTKAKFSHAIFFENCCLSTKFVCDQEKKTEAILKLSKNAAIKNSNHRYSIYGSCMISIFFTEKFSFLIMTLHLPICQNKKKNSRKFDETISANCMIFA